MKRLVTTIVALAALVWMLPAAAGAQTPSCDPGTIYSCFLLRAPYGLQAGIAQNHGLTILGEVVPGKPSLVLATGPSSILPETALANMQGDPDVLSVELNAVVDAKGGKGGGGGGGGNGSGSGEELINASNTSYLEDLAKIGIADSGPELAYFATEVWNGYHSQGAWSVTSANDLHNHESVPEAMGSGVVAIIDTGVDPNHPLLQGALLPGYDFILDQPGASEWNALPGPATTEANLRTVADQSHSMIVDGQGLTDNTYPARQPIVDQSHSMIVDDNQLPGAFGHGTMVAGIVRWLAPTAQILPIRVFDGNGIGDMARIIMAIDWAVANGADVINMSFSTSQSSRELARAVKAARRAGVVLVSSAGNLGNEQLTYPAAYGEVIGVASTTKQDQLSSFSSYGPDLVTLAAPGEQLITLYPGGLYAGAWGTSFSTAIVSGSVATLHGANKSITPAQAEQVYLTYSRADIEANLAGEVNGGRIDAHAAFLCGPNAPAGSTCVVP